MQGKTTLNYLIGFRNPDGLCLLGGKKLVFM